jgi:hypothetical protein
MGQGIGGVQEGLPSLNRDSQLLRYPATVDDMRGPTKERWFQLCQQAAVEQDPVKLLELITEINDILEQKEKRLKAEREAARKADLGITDASV